MDYPKSVPGVGLVDGKFIDENTTTGQVGSLIPCSWGNAVTDEILSVIKAAGLEPGEEDHDQLLRAIGVLVEAALPELPGEATSTVLGLVKQASKQEAEDGTDDKKSMSALRVHEAIAKKAPAAAVVVSIAASKALAAGDLGLVLVDSTVAATTITLPASNAVLGIRDVIIRRVDNGGNRLTVKAAGADKVKFHTHLRPDGYPFFVLMGAGDWWHLRSDGVGNWWPVGRYDNTPLGRPVMETTTAINPGGWGLYHGLIYNRADWPWVWDHAQASGMLTTEALRAGNEGCWTSGDGNSTFRSPEGRGEFLRVLDEGRGVEASRTAGSWQKGSYLYIEKAASTGVDRFTSSISYGVTGDLAAKARLGWDTHRNESDYGGQVTFGVNEVTVNATGPSATAPASFSVDASAYIVGSSRPSNIAYPGRLKLI